MKSEQSASRSDTEPKQLRRWLHREGEDDFATSSVGKEFFTVRETEYRELEAKYHRLLAVRSEQTARLETVEFVTACRIDGEWVNRTVRVTKPVGVPVAPSPLPSERSGQ